MPFITDANGNIKFVTTVPVTPVPGPVPVTPVAPQPAANSGVMVVTVTVSGVPVVVHSGSVPVHASGEVHRKIATDDVIRIVKVPPGFPPKPFRLKDYMK